MDNFQNNGGVTRPARVTGNRDLVTSSMLLKWGAQGKLFEAGWGAEAAAINSATSLVATTPTFSLQAPAATDLLVIPILAKFAIVADGGGITNHQLLFTKPAGLCATIMTLSGTAFGSKHCMYRSNPAKTAQQATALYTVTASALVAADYVSYHYGEAIDAVLTSGLVALGEGPSNVQTFRFLRDGLPHIMTSGAAMLIFVYTGTSASTVKGYMQWAEVTEDDLI